MEENKILEFVKEFNFELEKSNADYTPYNYLQYSNDGTVESVSLPEIVVFDDQNDSSEFFVANCSSNIVLTLENILKNAKKILDKNVNAFIKELTKDNNINRYELKKIKSTVWELTVGEDQVDSIWNNDFDYLFPGCKLIIKENEVFNLILPDELEIGMYCITKSGKTVQIEAHDMRDYPYVCFKRMATNAEIEEYKKIRR